LIEGFVEGDVELVYARRDGPDGKLVLVGARYVCWGKLLQLEPSKGWLNVNPDGDLLAVEGTLPDGAGKPLEPHIQVFPTLKFSSSKKSPPFRSAGCPYVRN
jgi:hypothetical protein